MSTRAHIHKPQRLGDKAADNVANFVGSWTFVVIMSVLMAGWILWNVCPFLPHFDPPQFVLLNLCLSFIAGYTGPFVMMSQNRQADKDRKRDDLEANEIETMFTSHKMLLQINHQQMDILTKQTDILNQQTEMLELLKRPPAKLKAVRVVRSGVDE